MIAREVAALHPAPVVDDGEGAVGGAREELDARSARIERVGGDLGEDGLLERAGVCVAQVLEEVLEVDPGFTHGGIVRGTQDAGRRTQDAGPAHAV